MKPVQIMGVLNITPDSFSDGGKFLNIDAACEYAISMIHNGADIIDIGGESSQPNAKPISINEELYRIIPVIKKLKKLKPDIRISVDTYKAEVMKEVLSLGINTINDIYGFRETNSLEAVKNADCDICVMHMKGIPQTMQHNPSYDDIIDELLHFFENKLQTLKEYHINLDRVIIDPGFGFGKTYEHNIEIIRNLERFSSLGVKLLIGISNKSIFDKMLGGREVNERMIASTAFNQIAIQKGADIIRTHNPKETYDMIKVLKAIHP